MSVLPERILLPTGGAEDAIRAPEAASDPAKGRQPNRRQARWC